MSRVGTGELPVASSVLPKPNPLLVWWGVPTHTLGVWQDFPLAHLTQPPAYMATPRGIWQPQGVHGNPKGYMATPRDTWQPQGIHGNPKGYKIEAVLGSPQEYLYLLRYDPHDTWCEHKTEERLKQSVPYKNCVHVPKYFLASNRNIN